MLVLCKTLVNLSSAHHPSVVVYFFLSARFASVKADGFLLSSESCCNQYVGTTGHFTHCTSESYSDLLSQVLNPSQVMMVLVVYFSGLTDFSPALEIC